MKNLSQLVAFVNRNKTKHINNLLLHSSSKTLELYHSIAENRFNSEKAAEKYFFPDSKFKHENFNRLKRRLFERLSDIILLIDFSKSPYEDYAKAQNYCAKNVAVINIWYYTVRALGYVINLAEKTVKIALHFGFTDHILSISRVCYVYYMQKNLTNKASKYEELINHYSKVLLAELKTEQYYLKFRKKFLRTQKPATKEELSEIIEKINEVEGFLRDYNSSRLNNFGFVFTIQMNEYLRRYDKIIQICFETLENSKQNPNKYPSSIINLSYSYSTLYLTKLARYQEAQELFQKRVSFFQPGSNNWFIFLYNYFILNIHSEEYVKAHEIYLEVFKHKNFHKISDNMKERWAVAEAYVSYLIKTNHLIDVETSTNFSIDRFLTKVPKQRADTGGYGISILIIEIIHRLLDAKEGHDKLVDRYEAYKIYMKRYLKHNSTFRMSCLLKMLITVINCNFHSVRTQAHVKDKGFLKKLKSLPYAEAKQAEDIEIIPFETLWQIVLDNLKT